MLQRVMPRFSAESFLSYSTETFRGGTRNPSVLCFIKFLVLKKYMDKKGGGGGDYRNFPSNIFCLKMPENFVGEPFSLSINSGIAKKITFRGLCHDFLFKFFFVSQCRNRP